MVLEPEKQCPNQAEHSPVRADGSAVGVGQHSPAFDRAFDDEAVVVDVAVQALVLLG